MSGAEHWDAAYGAREAEELTWYEARPDLSLELISELVHPGDPIVDVGAGASKLVDYLLVQGLGPVDLVDLSAEALRQTRERLAGRNAEVGFYAGDLLEWVPPKRYALWHDRAVFHFLTDTQARTAYVEVLSSALAPGGHAVIQTFAENGPDRCSGLPVERYGPDQLADELEALAPGAFSLVESRRHDHITPLGRVQKF